MSPVDITIHAQAGAARTGVMRLTHGNVPFPAFMPVGTYGTVKAMQPRDIKLGRSFGFIIHPDSFRPAIRKSKPHRQYGEFEQEGTQVLIILFHLGDNQLALELATHFNGLNPGDPLLEEEKFAWR